MHERWPLTFRQLIWAAARRLGCRTLTARTREGHRLKLRLQNPSAWPIYYGSYEPEETGLIGRLVKPGMVTMDVGANIGYFTVLMAHLVGPTGCVHAFEPNPRVCRELEFNIGLNPELKDGRIAVHNLALGSQNETADFFCPVSGQEGVGGLKDTRRVPVAGVIRVPVCTLDEVLQQHNLARVDFLKMDIEGGEFDLLRGSPRVLTELRPSILFEAYEVNTSAYGYRVFELLSFLEGQGYTVRQVGTGCNFHAEPRDRS